MKCISFFIKLKCTLGILLFAFLFLPALAQKKDNPSKSAAPQIIYYTSNNLKLKGYLYKPKGKGHFPVYMWLHGSEENPDSNSALASFWVKHGFIFFMPVRSGYDDNPGAYICNEEKQIKRRKETVQAQFRQIYALHKKQNEDGIAALKWIKQQPFADSNNIVVAGEDYGAIQVLITAEKDGQSSFGIKCFIAFPLPYETCNTLWSDSLKQAINMAKRPVFLLQTKNACPGDTLKDILDKKGFPNSYKLFPEEKGFSTDLKAWEKDVIKYLKECGVRR